MPALTEMEWIWFKIKTANESKLYCNKTKSRKKKVWKVVPHSWCAHNLSQKLRKIKNHKLIRMWKKRKTIYDIRSCDYYLFSIRVVHFNAIFLSSSNALIKLTRHLLWSRYHPLCVTSKQTSTLICVRAALKVVLHFHK